MNIEFKFNNLNVGSIDELIIEKFSEKDKLDKVKLINGLNLNVYKYKNAFPLILEEVKPLFNLSKVKYNIVSIENEKYYAYENLNNINLKEYMKYNSVKNNMKHKELQIIFIFNYLMCINCNLENKIHIFPSYNAEICDTRYETFVNFKVINEKSYKYNSNKVDVSKRIINEWFEDSVEEFQNLTTKIVKSIDAELLRQGLLKIVRKYDDNYVSWVNSVYNKILEAKGFFVEENDEN
jgi:hypothetical protein